MAIQPTDKLSTLTNPQCAQLRDEIASLLVASGVADPSVMAVLRRIRIAIDFLYDKKDREAELAEVRKVNAAREAMELAVAPIRERRRVRSLKDLGGD